MPRDPALYDRLGGDALRAVIVDFYARVFDDVMIGFLFAGKDRARLVELEWQFTARLLGADVAYTGRPMRQAHARSPIFGGHFERRLQLLRTTLRDHGVDPEVQEAWLGHQLALRAQITADAGSECKDSSVAVRLGDEEAAAGGKDVGPAEAPAGDIDGATAPAGPAPAGAAHVAPAPAGAAHARAASAARDIDEPAARPAPFAPATADAAIAPIPSGLVRLGRRAP